MNISNNLKTLRDFDFMGRPVLVRCDFNVPLSETGEVLDDFRIKSSLPTIQSLSEAGAKVILISHLEVKDEIVSLKAIRPKLEELLGKKIKFFPDCIGENVKKEVERMRAGEIILLENLRFYQGEKEADPQFAKELARLANFYVNEAFSCSHRNHASIAILPKYLPSAAGFQLEKEIKILSQILERPERPLVAIIGGIKIETKIKTILKFLEKADHLLLGSKIGEVILAEKMILVGRETGKEKFSEGIELTDPKLHLPIDGRISLKEEPESYFRIGGIGSLRKEEEIFDIGPETTKIFVNIIKEGKTIFWSGPLGMFEKKEFEVGTKEIAQAIIRNYSAFKIAGGGDTISALNQFGVADKFDFLSTGGGAMLEFLAGEKLPGIEALQLWKLKI